MKKIYTSIILFLIIGSLSFFAGVAYKSYSCPKSPEVSETTEIPGAIENDFANLEKNLTELKKDIGFYRNINLYMSLLNKEEYGQVQEKMQSFLDSEEFSDIVILYTLNELFKDEDIKDTVIDLKSKIYKVTNKELTKEEKDNSFEKNTACANMIPNIREQLAKKYAESNSTEELKFIFYSPQRNTCLYSTVYTYSGNSYKNNRNYYTEDKIIYDASTGTELESFQTYYSFNYPYMTTEEATTKAEEEKKEYIKFILENSNYNIDLVKDMSWF